MTAQPPATPAIPETMKAVVMRAPGDVVVEEVDTPRVAQPTDVVLKLAAACVCGSDLWPYRGHNDVDHRRMGHEYVGTIVEKGEDVATLEVGDFVIGSFMLSDNTCEICQAGYQSRCVNAGEYTGSQAQYMRIELADGSLVKVPGGEPSDPDRLADYLAASDVLGTGWYAAVAAQARALLDLAFTGLGVRRVEAHAFADNAPSLRVMAKVGLRHEGMFKEEPLHLTRGWIDGVTYAMLASEYRAQS